MSQQFRVTWPAEPAVAHAYLDQLERDGALSKVLVAELAAALELSASQLEDGASNKELAARLEALAGDLTAGDVTNDRRVKLARTLSGISARLD